MFQYTEIQKYPCIKTRRFKNFRVSYTQIFLEAKLSEIATGDENILGCESGDWVLPIKPVRKSHDTVPLKSW